MRDGERQFHETTTRFGLLRLDVEVRDHDLGVRMLPLQRSVEWIPSSQVNAARVVTYRASTYGGWHWGRRAAPYGNKIYRLRGNEGVELTLVNSRKVFIGSQRASELHAALTERR